MKGSLAAFLVLAVLLSFGSAHATNLLVNGGFETGDFTGWTITPTSLAVYPYVFIGTNPYSGSYNAVFGADNYEDLSTLDLSQTFSTTPGQSYTFDFWLEHNNTNNGNLFQASWNGNIILNLSNQAFFNYTEYTFIEVATGTSSTIAFSGYEPPGRYNLDNVSVTSNPVPLPSALALLAPGLCGLAAIRRRFRK
jgi:hypothetical protein